MRRTFDLGALLAERLWEGRSNAMRATRSLLAPLSAVFSAGVRARSRLYDGGRLDVDRAPVPVISVGGLRVGGSGKTPVVIWLADALSELGHRPLVVSRGYGGTRDRVVLALTEGLSDGCVAAMRQRGFQPVTEASSIDAAAVADEARLIAARTRTPTAVARRRAEAARLATILDCDCVVLDDGFQHRRLVRDLDIVIVAAGDDEARLLPAGPLREPWGALRRARVVLREGACAAVPGDAVVTDLVRRPLGLVDNVDADAVFTPNENLHGRDVVGVAAIARPARFFDMLRTLGARIRVEMSYRDHHCYTGADWRDIRQRAASGEWIVTTEKDLVKLRSLAGNDADLKALRIEAAPRARSDVLNEVAAALARLDPSRARPHDRSFGPNPAEREL